MTNNDKKITRISTGTQFIIAQLWIFSDLWIWRSEGGGESTLRVISYYLVWIAAVLPDLDYHIDGTSILTKHFSHGKLLHSPILYILIGAIGFIFPKYFYPPIAFALAGLTHIFLDLFSTDGIPFFYPFSSHIYSLGHIEKNTKLLKVLCIIAFLPYIAITIFTPEGREAIGSSISFGVFVGSLMAFGCVGIFLLLF